MEEKKIQMPVDRLSYSALTQLCRNPLIFKLKYILGVYDGKVGMSGMVGKAGHEALKYYYGGNPDFPAPASDDAGKLEAIDFGMKFLENYNDVYIEYGLTGNREKMLASYTKAMQYYFAEEPEYHIIVQAEKKLEAEIETVEGQKFALPVVGVPDMVEERKDGGTQIIDTKFVKTFTKYENADGQPHEDYVKIIQSQFMWHLVRKTLNRSADKMLFREIKYTENKGENAGQPQVRDYMIPLNHEPYRIIFNNVFKDVIKFLSNPDAVFLPNFSDPFDGEQAGFLYAQGLLDADMSDVEVMHKVKDLAFVSKKFVGSRLDKIENKHLNPEEKIKLRLAEFGIPVEPVEPVIGSSVIQYRFKVSAGIRMSVFEKHKADIALAIEAKTDIRILAPIPGTSFIGIEIPKETRENVMLGKEHLVPDTLSIPIGMTMQGDVVKALLNEMPHLLIAGSAGSGKSILLHVILTALTKQNKPENMKLVLIDPKRVELTAFAKVKHLGGSKIAYEYDHAVQILKALTEEMEVRYKILEKAKVKDIQEYNDRERMTGPNPQYMPWIVVVIDEFGDLIIQGKSKERTKKSRKSISVAANKAYAEVVARQMAKQGIRYTPSELDEEMPPADELIARLGQMARAAGIHMIIATQRPSVDVITGIIKANFPTRVALTTASAIDSKVILGEDGAEKLSGKGDMLFVHPGAGGKVRLQGFMLKK